MDHVDIGDVEAKKANGMRLVSHVIGLTAGQNEDAGIDPPFNGREQIADRSVLAGDYDIRVSLVQGVEEQI